MVDNGKKSNLVDFNIDCNRNNLKKKALKSGGITFLSKAINFAIQLVGTIFLTRILAPKDFGLIAMVISFTGLFSMITAAGITDATMQEENINQSKLSSIFWIDIIISSVFSILFIGLSPILAWLYNEPELINITLLLSSSFILISLSTVPMALLKRNFLFHKVAFIELTASFLSTVLAVILALKHWNYWALVARNLTLSLFTAMLALFVLQWRPSFKLVISEIRSMLFFVSNVSGYYFVNHFVRNIDKILIGWRYGAAAVGYYQRAVQLSGLLVFQLTVPFHSVAVATFSKLRGNKKTIRDYYIKTISIMSFVGMPLCAFMVTYSEDIVLLLFGPKWGKTAEILSILGIAAATTIIYATQGWLHVSLGRADRWRKWGFFAAIPITLAIVVGLMYGPIGVAKAYALVSIVLIWPSLSYAGKPINLKFEMIFSNIWKYLVASLITAILSHYISISSSYFSYEIIKLFVHFIIFLGLYFVIIIVLFKGLSPIRIFINLLKEMISRKR